MDYQAHKEALDRAKLAREALTCCNLCPRRCGIDRTIGEKGYCGLDDSVRCFREMLYFGEESELIPTQQIHFTGCNLRCEFCVVSEWNEQPLAAEEMNVDDMVKRIAYRQSQGAKTLNLVGGEPAVNLYGILELLGRIDSKIKVVWNSNMYYNNVVDKLITGLADIYLADLKCGNSRCAAALLGAENYVSAAKENILKAYKHADVIVRHLVMPGHSECCLKPILRWLSENIPQVKLSLRGNYIPPAEAVSAPKGYLKKEDMQLAVDLAGDMGLRLIR
jgi:putative pyruvate formate lyase activating enzyme